MNISPSKSKKQISVKKSTKSAIKNTKNNIKNSDKKSVKKSSKKISNKKNNSNATNIFVLGKYQLSCPVCQNNKFFSKTSMLRGGRWASFFDAEWLFDNSAKIAICSRCSYISWFKDKNKISTQIN